MTKVKAPHVEVADPEFPIPEDFKTSLNGREKIILAARVTKAPVKTEEEADKALDMELSLRAEASGPIDPQPVATEVPAEPAPTDNEKKVFETFVEDAGPPPVNPEVPPAVIEEVMAAPDLPKQTSMEMDRPSAVIGTVSKKTLAEMARGSDFLTGRNHRRTS